MPRAGRLASDTTDRVSQLEEILEHEKAKSEDLLRGSSIFKPILRITEKGSRKKWRL